MCGNTDIVLLNGRIRRGKMNATCFVQTPVPFKSHLAVCFASASACFVYMRNVYVSDCYLCQRCLQTCTHSHSHETRVDASHYSSESIVHSVGDGNAIGTGGFEKID